MEHAISERLLASPNHLHGRVPHNFEACMNIFFHHQSEGSCALVIEVTPITLTIEPEMVSIF